jgi:selenocysteine-specific elongation factor
LSGAPPARAAGRARQASGESGGARWVPPALLGEIADRALGQVKRFHQAEPSLAGISRETLRSSLHRYPEALVEATIERLARTRKITVKDGAVAVAGFAPTLVGGEGAVTRLIELITASQYEPPDTAELARALGVPTVVGLVKQAVERGAITAVERDRFYARDLLDRFVTVLETIGEAGEITPAKVRQSINTSRKFLIPLLEWADRQGVTRREGDSRVLVRNGRSRAR